MELLFNLLSNNKINLINLTKNFENFKLVSKIYRENIGDTTDVYVFDSCTLEKKFKYCIIVLDELNINDFLSINTICLQNKVAILDISKTIKTIISLCDFNEKENEIYSNNLVKYMNYATNINDYINSEYNKLLLEKDKEILDLNKKYLKSETNFKGMYERNKKLQQNIIKLEEEKEKIKKHLSYILGYRIVHTNTFFKLISLPFLLYKDYKYYQSQNKKKKLLKTNIKKIKKHAFKGDINKIKIACIMDDFTYNCFKYEAELIQLSLKDFKTEINDFKPDFVFLESAWQGKNNEWHTKLSNFSIEIQELISFTKEQKIPIMFWSKEDPVHFETFLNVAKNVDYIFTTDIDCVPKYKYFTNNNNVYFLPFAAQTAIHNPIEKYERKDEVCFAGSYYLKYPIRQRNFNSLIDSVMQFKNIEIYDRNYGKEHSHYKFPDKYKHFIIGNLPTTEIDKAYKGYNYGINMNTVKYSQTMFARRVYELMASNTFVISNYSLGLKLMFENLCVNSDNINEITQYFSKIVNDNQYYKKIKLLALRKVLSEHTYKHRLNFLLSTIFNISTDNPKNIFLCAKINDEIELELTVSMFNRQQNIKNKTLLICGYKNSKISNYENIVFLDAKQNLFKFLQENQCDYLAFINPNDYYGKNYLYDLYLAFSYTDSTAVGKAKSYSYIDHNFILENDGLSYSDKIQQLNIFSSLLDFNKITEKDFKEIVNNNYYSFEKMLSIDEFNYCKNGSNIDVIRLNFIDDLCDVNTGIELKHFYDQTKNINYNLRDSKKNILFSLNLQEIYNSMQDPATSKLKIEFIDKKIVFKSSFAANEYKYIYIDKLYKRQDVNLQNNSEIKIIAKSDLPKFELVVLYFDKNKEKKSHTITTSLSTTLPIPSECMYIKIGFKFTGNGKVTIQDIIIDNIVDYPQILISKNNILVLTKQYPSYEDIYRYGFLHSRIREYKKQGLEVDIFKISNNEQFNAREFENINIITGDNQLLENCLKNEIYKQILVHLIDRNMWQILKKYLDNIKLTIWVHGAEIQVWQRREYEFELLTEEQIIRQKELSTERIKLWHEIIKLNHPNIHFVFVSEYFKNESLNDLGLTLAKDRYSIIHNYIDSSIFKYQEKVAQDRLKILSIRPYASRKYANDLSVKAILELSKKEYFNELEFCLIGDGELFEETVKPLKNFKNVKLIKKFITHDEIAKIHKEYGIFLTPTRMDSQGVSRDEAMSSGLVSITTNVAAIPEFVDNTCSMVVEPENPKALADAIDYLYHNPDKFLELSKRGSKRVDELSSFKETILKEINLIRGNNKC